MSGYCHFQNIFTSAILILEARITAQPRTVQRRCCILKGEQRLGVDQLVGLLSTSNQNEQDCTQDDRSFFLGKDTRDTLILKEKEKVMKPHIFKPNVLLVQARRDLGLSQGDVAQRLKVSLQAVWRWENGIAQPYPRHCQLLCTLFQKTARELGLDSTKSEFSEPTLKEEPIEAQFRAFLESCQSNPVYQSEYQTFIRRCRRFNPQCRRAIGFVDWFLAAHPEHLSTSDYNDDTFHQPA